MPGGEEVDDKTWYYVYSHTAKDTTPHIMVKHKAGHATVMCYISLRNLDKRPPEGGRVGHLQYRMCLSSIGCTALDAQH